MATFPPLTRNELDRAIYIDFEGRREASPALLGILWPGATSQHGFQQLVLDPLFYEAGSARDCSSAELREAIEELLHEADAHDLVFVAWSRHELDVIRGLGDDEIARRFEARFRDAKALARTWITKCHPSLNLPRHRFYGRYRLAPIMAFAGWHVATSHGPELTGRRLAYLGSQLEKHAGDFSRLTPNTKGKWTNLLRHNRHDCYGMRHVCETALRDLAPSEEPGGVNARPAA